MSRLTVALAGNPNAGKSTLFNALTGARQRVGNWPGVTVERRTGVFTEQGVRVEVVDLPGTYALSDEVDAVSMDEQVACQYLLSGEADLVVNIVDATHLERSLYLTVQLLEQGIPLIVVVNMVDLAQKRGLSIDFAALSKALGCPVMPLMARRKTGMPNLKQEILLNLPSPGALSARGEGPGVKVSTEHEAASPPSPPPLSHTWERGDIDAVNEDADILRADARYRFIHAQVQQAVRQSSKDRTLTRVTDRIVLNRFLGIPIFLTVMYAMFFFALNLGGVFQGFFDIASETVFVGGVAEGLHALGMPAFGVALLANGVGKGIHTTLTFVPVLAALFFFLALLEDSGYMARAAFIVDRLMRFLGLPGKSLVPVIVGFGCNVPAVMAARTLENERDRILTVMMSPFVPCGARLAIFTVFVAAFFPKGGSNVVFCLYLAGIAMAMLTGFLIRKTVLSGEPAPLVMELPAWLVPDPKTLILHTWQRLRGFVVRAGRLIVPVCVLIGALNALNIDGTLNTGEGHVHSILSAMGRLLTPIFSPMGLDADNWPATVGLVTGVLAKEVVIGTLNTLYSQAGHLTTTVTQFDFWTGWHEAVASISANWAALSSAFTNPVLAGAPIQSLSQSVYGIMYQRFHGQIGAFAYLLFVLLYFPCVSTLAVMWREVGHRWTLFSVFWSMGVAYAVAVLFYQLAMFSLHPSVSLGWVGAVILSGFLMITLMRHSMRRLLV